MRLRNPLHSLDRFLLTRVFMPIAHQIDYRWHINQYKQASYLMHLAIAMCWGLVLEDIIVSHFAAVGFAPCIGSVGLTTMYGIIIRDLANASEEYERLPDQMTVQRAQFLLFRPSARLLFISVAIIIDCGQFHGTLAQFILQQYFWAIAIAWYIAGGLPPHRDRKKAKERQPSLTAAPSTVG
jgi:hypothetical protein